MAELELVRVDQDGASLVLRAPDGTHHALPVTDALRAAIARAPRAAEPSPTPPPTATPAATVRPRDLQARLRAGATAEELAAQSGLPVEHVRRYEWPVLTEREHVIGMVRSHDVPGLDGTRELGTIADARLAARGVQPQDATWTARREGNAPWVVEVRFSAGDRERSARWTFDLKGRLVTPLDDEARWLGQPDDPLTPEVRGVPSLSARRALNPADGAGTSRGAGGDRGGAWAASDETDLLLDDLAGRRGHRTSGRAHRPATSSLPPVSPLTPPPAAGSDDGDGGFQVVPLGDLPVRERPLARHIAQEPVTEAGASVVDLGRWNPRRPRDKSVSPGGGPGATQPALLTPTGVAASESSPEAATTPDAPPGAAPSSETPEDGAARKPAATVAATPRTPARGVPATRRKGRAQVPSWDEIVFGARPEPS